MNRKQLENKIKTICHELIYKQGYINSIDVLKSLDYLSNDNIRAWKTGQVPYLEKICNANLATLSFINKTIKKITFDLKLKQSLTYYKKNGKGPKTKLIFSKSGDEKIEKAYSTHYIDSERINELKNIQTTENKGL